MEHGIRAPRTSVQNGAAWRAWRRTDQVPAGRTFPWRAGAGAAWICAAEHRASPPMDDRRYKSCRRVTRSGHVPRSQLPLWRWPSTRQRGWLPQALVHSCRQSGGESTMERLSRACASAEPAAETAFLGHRQKRPALPQAVAAHGGPFGCLCGAVAAGQLQRFLFRRASVNQVQKPQPLAVPVLQCAITFPPQLFHGKVTCSRLKKEKCSGLNPSDSSSRLNSSGPRYPARAIMSRKITKKRDLLHI